MTTERHVETPQSPRADANRFCPYHGGYVKLADCPVVATSDQVNRSAGARDESRAAAGAAPSLEYHADLGGADDESAGSATAVDSKPASGARSRVRVRADVVAQVGQLVESQIDGRERLVLATGPGYVPRRLRQAPELEAPAMLARGYGGAVVRPARACPTCLHPLPATIDYRDTYPVILVGHEGSSKTSTIVALIDAAGSNEPEALGVSRFMPTEATSRYLLSMDEKIFVNFRNGIGPERTQQNTIHPPLEFLTTLGLGGPAASLLIHDVAGETLTNPDTRLQQAPSVLWADAILFIYNPENSPLLTDGSFPDQAHILNGLRDDLETRGPRDPSGRAYEEPALLFVVSKADLVPNCPDLREGTYNDTDVHAALRSLGDQAVINAANRFPTVHWLLMAPMPEQGGGPQGVIPVLKLLLQELS
jgi:hypothetical protein